MSVFFLDDLMIDMLLIPIPLSSSNICCIFSYLFAFFFVPDAPFDLFADILQAFVIFTNVSFLRLWPLFLRLFHIVVHSCRVVIPLKSLPFHLLLLLKADSMVYSTSSFAFSSSSSCIVCITSSSPLHVCCKSFHMFLCWRLLMLPFHLLQ